MSVAGDASSDDGGSGNANGEAQQIDEEHTLLMKESEHVPLLREHILQEKIKSALTAAGRGDKPRLEALFSSDEIDFNCKDEMQRTPLHIAASEGHVHVAEYLLLQKADPSAKDKFGNSPFNDAVRSKQDRVVALMKALDPNVAFKLGGSELGVLMCKAAHAGKLDDIKRLVENGVDPNEADYDGRTAMHLAASEGAIDIMNFLVEIKANIMCRDRFNGTPLEDAVRHHFEIRDAEKVQKVLRDHGATLAGEGLKYVIKMCEYASEGNVERIRLLSDNGVDVSLGDYDDRTPLHLAACNGHTAVLEFLLQHKDVLVNAVDRFGGTPFVDSVRHERKGAAALLEEAGCVRTTDSKSKKVITEMIEKSNMKKEARLRAEREPRIQHVLENSQESKMVATISDTLSKKIAAQSAQIELISQRLIWALRGFGQRLHRNSCNIPFTETAFVKAAEHVLKLVTEMRASVNTSRSSLMAEMQGDEGAADCLIWRNASKEYKSQAQGLESQMCELITLAKVAKRMLKEVLKVCARGQRQELYADSTMKRMMASALLDQQVLEREQAEAAARSADVLARTRSKASLKSTGSMRWGGLKMAVNVFGMKRVSSIGEEEEKRQRQDFEIQQLQDDSNHGSTSSGDQNSSRGLAGTRTGRVTNALARVGTAANVMALVRTASRNDLLSKSGSDLDLAHLEERESRRRFIVGSSEDGLPFVRS